MYSTGADTLTCDGDLLLFNVTMCLYHGVMFSIYNLYSLISVTVLYNTAVIESPTLNMIYESHANSFCEIIIIKMDEIIVEKIIDYIYLQYRHHNDEVTFACKLRHPVNLNKM